MSAMTPAALADKITEHNPLRRWRLQQLKCAGYPPSDALVLSGRAEVDLHVAVKLLQHGCPVETAMRILL
jgi:hypothetical protein